MQSADVRLFSREIAILRRLHSPYIVEFLGAHFAPPRFCIVMEYMDNGSLRRVLQERRFPEEKRVAGLLVRLSLSFSFSLSLPLFLSVSLSLSLYVYA